MHEKKKSAGFFNPTCGGFSSSSNEISPDVLLYYGELIYFGNREYFNIISGYARERFFLILKKFILHYISRSNDVNVDYLLKYFFKYGTNQKESKQMNTRFKADSKALLFEYSVFTCECVFLFVQ